jgi:hypothetical protein
MFNKNSLNYYYIIYTIVIEVFRYCLKQNNIKKKVFGETKTVELFVYVQ